MRSSKSLCIGERFGKWIIIGPSYIERRQSANCVNYVTRYPCQCDCGTERAVRAFKLLTNSKSCGCDLQRQRVAKTIKHGHTCGPKATKAYRTWTSIISRCCNKNNSQYYNYGGRGIRICKQWRESFIAFNSWAENNGIAPNLQIDRIDNDGDYSPENCRWVTDAQNKRNTRKTRHLTALGETKCFTDWALDPRCSVSPGTIKNRIEKFGWSPEKAITFPRQTKKSYGRFLGHHIKQEA